MKNTLRGKKDFSHIDAYDTFAKAWQKFTTRMEEQRSKLHMHVEAIKAQKSIKTL